MAGQLIAFEDINSRIITIRERQVLLNSDVAALYGVETRAINQAVKNNPDKFPSGYVFDLKASELHEIRSKKLILKDGDIRSNILILKEGGRGQHSKYTPTAFTEKGLYMLATILKSKQATETTIAIVETFAKLRELSRAVAELSQAPEEERQKSLMKRSGEILGEILGDELKTTDTETSIELNFAVLKLKHTVKKKG